jgi:hypothetical protein
MRRFRQRLGPVLNRLTGVVGQPTTQVYPSGYVATVHRPHDAVAAELEASGFTWDPLSMFHYTPTGSSTDGSWAYRSGPFAERQLHVVLFATRPDRTDVYAHDEFNWLRHPLKHADEVDIRRKSGATTMRRWLADSDLPAEQHSLARRKLGHAVERLRERLRGRGHRLR